MTPGRSALSRLAALALVACLAVPAPAAEPAALRLAVELAGEVDHAGAAIEFRRLALASERPGDAAAYYWTAAHAYGKSGRFDVADRLLGRAEDLVEDYDDEIRLLRADHAEQRFLDDEAVFFFEGLALHGDASPLKSYAGRRLAALHVRSGRVDEALAVLDAALPDADSERRALDAYAEGRDKSPRLGGLLGMVPGLGYFYAGEYANGVRSIILNALFIYGMVDTAGDEQWGAFGVITFFEITWYSGSIYGGVDAAERYNQRRRETAAEAVMGGSTFAPDYPALPLLRLDYRF